VVVQGGHRTGGCDAAGVVHHDVDVVEHPGEPLHVGRHGEVGGYREDQ